MQYDVEADFYPLTTCNFRCTYCFLSPAALGAKLTIFGNSSQWQAGFDVTGKIWLLHITGGEPFLYPGFVDLCQRLGQRHYLSINTNLAHRSVEEFAVTIDPRRVHYIHAAAHLAEREDKGCLDELVARVHRLRAAGFAVFVTQVMTPAVIEYFPRIRLDFAQHDIMLIPKTLRGRYQGKWYPAAYSPAHRTLLRAYQVQVQASVEELLKTMPERPTIDPRLDTRFLNGIPHYRGRRCGAGHNFVQVRPDGTVLRCGSGEQLGNVLHKTVRLLDGPRVCDTSYCPYFCEKYTSAQYV